MTLESYIKSLKDAIDIYSLHFTLPKVAYERKLEELFFLGLEKATMDHLIIVGKTKFSESYDVLKRLESEIVRKYNISANIESEEGKKILKKWCKHHKVLEHSSKECKLNLETKCFSESKDKTFKQKEHNCDKPASSNYTKDHKQGFKNKEINSNKSKESDSKNDIKNINNYMMVERVDILNFIVIPIVINDTVV